ncbi:MAG: LytR C-terminal domain-containing protein, partial [Actinomycetota bacterium]|nr:LytR C-terminal domain-containing protein [Actinomycetota bacterium]
YVATTPHAAQSAHTVAASQTPTPTPTPVASQTSAPATPAPKTQKPKPVVKRADVYVEVYNNSGIGGLAGRTSGKAQAVGWKVVGSDNWYGTIPATTVYYPARLQAAAKMLARDLGITRIRPAIQPMRFDRLTVILTSDYTP